MTRTRRTVEDQEHWYICGQCGLQQYATIDDEPLVPCVDCNWPHREKKKYDLPSEIKWT